PLALADRSFQTARSQLLSCMCIREGRADRPSLDVLLHSCAGIVVRPFRPLTPTRHIYPQLTSPSLSAGVCALDSPPALSQERHETPLIECHTARLAISGTLALQPVGNCRHSPRLFQPVLR